MNETRYVEAARQTTLDSAAMLAREAALWADVQRDLLGGVATAVTDWLQRQREGLDASSRSIQRFYECRSLADLIAVQQDWARDCLRWTAAQLRTAERGSSLVARETARFAEAAAEAPRPAGVRPRGAAQPEPAQPVAAK